MCNSATVQASCACDRWVREFAVLALRERATDSQLLSYLLSLVQVPQHQPQP